MSAQLRVTVEHEGYEFRVWVVCDGCARKAGQVVAARDIKNRPRSLRTATKLARAHREADGWRRVACRNLCPDCARKAAS